MTDYISREKAIEAIRRIGATCNPNDFDLEDKEGYGWWMHSNGENLSVIKAELEIEKVPAADVKPVVHGHWFNAYPDIEPNPMFMYGFCSVCGFEQSISDKLKYCPGCGARMGVYGTAQI